MGFKNINNLEEDDDENYVGEDSNILNILDRIDTNISLAKNNIIQPLKTSKGDNKVEKSTDDGSNQEIKVPSSVYKKPDEPPLTTIGSMYSINTTSKPIPPKNNDYNSNITKKIPNKKITTTSTTNIETSNTNINSNSPPSVHGTKLIDLD
ncbi:hypothetical protein ACTFIZ_000666 [Dictyostelium cf. discoideum]